MTTNKSGWGFGFLLSAVLSTGGAAQTWNAANDFSTSVNPAGAWSYGWKQSAAATFTLYTTTTLSCGSVEGWHAGGAPTAVKNTSSTAACCFFWRMPPQSLDFHPGQGGERSTYRWTAPYAGTFAVAADFAGIDYQAPTTSDVEVDVNGSVVYSLFINSYSAGTDCLTTLYVPAGSYQGAHALALGDHIDVSVGWGANGNYFGDTTLVSIVITGSPPATATPVGNGCGAGSIAPVLSVTPPVIGQAITFSIANGAPFAGGALFASTPPAGSIPLGAGCMIYLDLATYFPLFDPIATNASGAWSVGIVLPYDAGLFGFQVALQGALYPTAGPLGIDLTNGVLATVGL